MIDSRLKIIGICLLLSFISSQAYAQLYKWVDADGRVHYGDSPPEDVSLKQINGQLSSYTSVSVESLSSSAATLASKKVVMYSTEWCGYCRKARAYFRKHDIAFTEFDIEKSETAAREFKALNGRGVPVILIGQQRMNGFSQQTFKRLYDGSS